MVIISASVTISQVTAASIDQSALERGGDDSYVKPAFDRRDMGKGGNPLGVLRFGADVAINGVGGNRRRWPTPHIDWQTQCRRWRARKARLCIGR